MGKPARRIPPDAMPDSVIPCERIEMFVDGRLLERRRGVEHRLAVPERREIVLVTDRPWEGSGSAYYSVFRDGDRIRLYYRGHTPDDLSGGQVTCTAESRDGVVFTRPEVGLFEFEGSTANNIVHRGVESHNLAPFLDANPDAPPEMRYKALGGVDGRLFAFHSPDGYRWTRMDDSPVMTSGAFDSLNVAFRDAAADLYRSYSRCWTGGGYRGFRAIQTASSPDFLHWTDPEPILLSPGEPEEHLYTSAAISCPGAPHHLLAFPKRFVPERTKLDGYGNPGVSDAVFLSSRDGRHWDRTFREAWIRPGPDERNWTQRSNMTAWGMIETGDAEMSLYISEHYGWPDNRLRRLTVGRHRFASLHAGAEEGEAVTRPILLAGRRLLLNASTSAAGSVRVEILDAGGRPIPGYTMGEAPPFFGDEYTAEARWTGGTDLSSLTNRPVRLRFLLRDADLFAISFDNE